MAFSKPYTQRELDYIRDNWPARTCEQIAADLGRSERGVYKKVNDMRLRDRPAADRGQKPAVALAAASEGGTLEDLRDLLWTMLQSAEPRDAARLAREYRETLGEIEKQEASDGGGGIGEEADPIADRIRLVSGC